MFVKVCIQYSLFFQDLPSQFSSKNVIEYETSMKQKTSMTIIVKMLQYVLLHTGLARCLS